MKIIVIFTYATIIVLRYKPRKVKQINIEFKIDRSYKLTKVDAG